MTSIGTILDRHRGIAPGFDVMRHVMALAVVAWHGSAVVTGDLAPRGRLLELIAYCALAAFFALGGFLVTASATRLSLGDFLANRVLRIVPALAVEVALCALILGPIFTTLPLAAYFADPQLYVYLTNIVGIVNYQLPGVFKNHPSDVVNVTLWTIPHELVSYVILCAFIVTGCLRRPLAIWLAAALFTAVGAIAFFAAAQHLPALPARIVDKVFVGEASRLYMGFMVGALAYLYRYRIPYDGRILLVALTVVGLTGAADLLSLTDLPVFPIMNVLALPALTYVVVYLGMSNLWGSGLVRRADYSYGIYLYGWPLQQVLVALLPGLKSPTAHVLLVMPLVIAVAILSWHAVERPVLVFRKTRSLAAQRRLAAEATATAAGRVIQPAQPALRKA